MSTRKRDILPTNNCFFITTTFRDWLSLLINDKYYQIIIDSIAFCLVKYKADLIVYSLMPNHIHMVLFFGDQPRIPEFMRDLKKYTSTKIRQNLDHDHRSALIEKLRFEKGMQRFKVWKERYDAVIIRDQRVLATKINYIHENSVRKGLVENPEDWEFSSAKYYLNGQQGRLPIRNAGEIA